jgi:hypothetical protein
LEDLLPKLLKFCGVSFTVNGAASSQQAIIVTAHHLLTQLQPKGKILFNAFFRSHFGVESVGEGQRLKN